MQPLSKKRRLSSTQANPTDGLRSARRVVFIMNEVSKLMRKQRPSALCADDDDEVSAIQFNAVLVKDLPAHVQQELETWEHATSPWFRKMMASQPETAQQLASVLLNETLILSADDRGALAGLYNAVKGFVTNNSVLRVLCPDVKSGTQESCLIFNSKQNVLKNLHAAPVCACSAVKKLTSTWQTNRAGGERICSECGASDSSLRAHTENNSTTFGEVHASSEGKADCRRAEVEKSSSRWYEVPKEKLTAVPQKLHYAQKAAVKAGGKKGGKGSRRGQVACDPLLLDTCGGKAGLAATCAMQIDACLRTVESEMEKLSWLFDTVPEAIASKAVSIFKMSIDHVLKLNCPFSTCEIRIHGHDRPLKPVVRAILLEILQREDESESRIFDNEAQRQRAYTSYSKSISSPPPAAMRQQIKALLQNHGRVCATKTGSCCAGPRPFEESLRQNSFDASQAPHPVISRQQAFMTQLDSVSARLAVPPSYAARVKNVYTACQVMRKTVNLSEVDDDAMPALALACLNWVHSHDDPLARGSFWNSATISPLASLKYLNLLKAKSSITVPVEISAF